MFQSLSVKKIGLLRVWLSMVLSLVALTCLTIASPVSAASCVSIQVLSSDLATRELANYAQELVEDGLSQAEATTQVASDFCLTQISGQSVPAVMPMASTNGSITFSAPSVFYDSATKMYYSLTGWNWNNTDFLSEVYPNLNSTENNGNPDAFSSIVTGTPLVISSTLTYGDKGCYFGATSDTSPDGNSGDGFLYKFQDKVRNAVTKKCYNVSSGQMSMQIQNPITCKDIQLKSKYVHTWNASGITSWSLSNTGIAVTISNSASSWVAASNYNPIFTIC